MRERERERERMKEKRERVPTMPFCVELIINGKVKR